MSVKQTFSIWPDLYVIEFSRYTRLYFVNILRCCSIDLPYVQGVRYGCVSFARLVYCAKFFAVFATDPDVFSPKILRGGHSPFVRSAALFLVLVRSRTCSTLRSLALGTPCISPKILRGVRLYYVKILRGFRSYFPQEILRGLRHFWPQMSLPLFGRNVLHYKCAHPVCQHFFSVNIWHFLSIEQNPLSEYHSISSATALAQPFYDKMHTCGSFLYLCICSPIPVTTLFSGTLLQTRKSTRYFWPRSCLPQSPLRPLSAFLLRISTGIFLRLKKYCFALPR